MSDSSLLTRLKQRKLVQWALAYIAAAWVLLQVMEVLAEPLGLRVSLRAALIDNPAVAILPLESGGSAEDTYFAEGVHEDILTSLQKIGALTVFARPAVAAYQGTDKTLREIGEELGADAIGIS